MISEEMLKKAAAEADQQSRIRSPLQQNVNMNFHHRFKEKCAAPFVRQNIP